MTPFDRMTTYFRAVAAMRVDDAATRGKIAELLGLRAAPVEETAADVATESADETSPLPSPAVALPAPAQSPAPAPATPPRRPRKPTAELLLTPLRPRRDRPPWLDSVPWVPQEPAEPRQPAPPESLFMRRWTRGILSTAIARPSQTNAIDIDAVLKSIVRGEPLRRIPRCVVPSLARSVQVLIDDGEAMAPYVSDVRMLVEQIRAVAGRERVHVLRFEPAARFVAGSGRRRGWKNYFAAHRTLPGITIVLLTDAGIAPVPIGSGAAPEQWLEFAERLRACGNPLLAFVPYPPRRWPPALRNLLRMVPWDRRTSVQSVRRILGGWRRE